MSGQRGRRRRKNEGKRAEVWGAFDYSITHTTPHTRLRYIVLHSWRKSGTPKELVPSYSTFMFLKPAKALFVPLYSFSTIGQRQPSSVGGTKFIYIFKRQFMLGSYMWPQYNPNLNLHHQIRSVEKTEIKMCDPYKIYKALSKSTPLLQKVLVKSWCLGRIKGSTTNFQV